MLVGFLLFKVAHFKGLYHSLFGFLVDLGHGGNIFHLTFWNVGSVAHILLVKEVGVVLLGFGCGLTLRFLSGLWLRRQLILVVTNVDTVLRDCERILGQIVEIWYARHIVEIQFVVLDRLFVLTSLAVSIY